jgi:hypothetical protein
MTKNFLTTIAALLLSINGVLCGEPMIGTGKYCLIVGRD